MDKGLHAKEQFQKVATHRLQFSLFLLRYLPAAFFSGVRVRGLNGTACTVSIPYKWFTRNPFRSTYFACLAMAAELSTGALAMLHVRGAAAKVSMLVLNMQADFQKKATGVTVFTCKEGLLLEAAVAAAQQEPQTCTVTSTGVNSNGEVVAAFRITWTFKAR